MNTATLTLALSHPMGEGESFAAVLERREPVEIGRASATPKSADSCSLSRPTGEGQGEGLPQFTLKDKVAIITGAVGNLGAATAHVFQRAGAKTVLVDRSQDRVREAFSDIADSENHLLAGGIDLSDVDHAAVSCVSESEHACLRGNSRWWFREDQVAPEDTILRNQAHSLR